MNLKTRKLIWEISVIVIFSMLFAVFYNLISTNPLPFIREKKTVSALTDSLLSILEGKDTAHISKINQLNTEKPLTQETQRNDNIKQKDTKPDNETAGKPAEPPQKSVQSISYAQVVKNLNNKNFLFVDARSADEFKNGHIGNAVNIFAYETDQNLYFSSITKLPADKILIVYCDGGECDASHKLSEDIKSFGYKKVLLYEGGWEEWTSKQKSK